MQSLLLEGGPTLAASFLAADLVDKVLLFVAPVLAGDGPARDRSATLAARVATCRPRQVGDDVLLEAYVHDP